MAGWGNGRIRKLREVGKSVSRPTRCGVERMK
jgi:hypothetical protein